jgi:hypothetical protein
MLITLLLPLVSTCRWVVLEDKNELEHCDGSLHVVWYQLLGEYDNGNISG